MDRSAAYLNSRFDSIVAIAEELSFKSILRVYGFFCLKLIEMLTK